METIKKAPHGAALITGGIFILGFATGCMILMRDMLAIGCLWAGSALIIAGTAALEKAKDTAVERDRAIADIDDILTECYRNADDYSALTDMCHKYCKNHTGGSCFEQDGADEWRCKKFVWNGGKGSDI